MSTIKKPQAVSAVELISIVGFSLSIAWMCLSFLWIGHVTEADNWGDVIQAFIFLGVTLGFVLLYFLGRNSRFNLFSPAVMGVELICAVLLPVLVFVTLRAVTVPVPFICLANFLAGIAGALLVTSWLDILSRLGAVSYGRFIGGSFVWAILFFLLVAFMPADMQPVFCVAYAAFGIGLLAFATKNAEDNDKAAPLESTEDEWHFTKEIEPSFFVFGIVFAMNFVFLFNAADPSLLFGFVAIIPGALISALLSIRERHIDVTIVQRVLLIVTVFSCVLVPFSQGAVQLGSACLAVAAWAFFKTMNFRFIVRKCVIMRTSPFFRQAPLRLCVSSAGFCLGWLLASLFTVFYGAHSEPFTWLRLGMVLVLVIVMMVFFPIGQHHPADGTERSERAQQDQPVYTIQMDESELFDERCRAIVKLYQLSPREADILGYLAKGRNAAWIVEELTISPHTVKSHIYNIYRKLDIHSQQKLMSFVEEFPLDL